MNLISENNWLKNILSLRLLNLCCFCVVDFMLSSALISHWRVNVLSWTVCNVCTRTISLLCLHLYSKIKPNVVCVVCSDWLPTMALDQSHKLLSGGVWRAVNVRFRLLFLSKQNIVNELQLSNLFRIFSEGIYSCACSYPC